MKKLPNNVSELRILSIPGEGWYIGRQYYEARMKRWEAWGEASPVRHATLKEARSELTSLVKREQCMALPEMVACGVYSDLSQGREHRTAVFAALTAEANTWFAIEKEDREALKLIKYSNWFTAA